MMEELVKVFLVSVIDGHCADNEVVLEKVINNGGELRL